MDWAPVDLECRPIRSSCCGKYVKDNIDQPTLFDEWLIEVESMSEAMSSLKNFDEEAGESS